MKPLEIFQWEDGAIFVGGVWKQLLKKHKLFPQILQKLIGFCLFLVF